MPVFMIKTRTAYQKPMVPKAMIQPNLQAAIQACKEEMAAEEMILSMEILEGETGKILWDSSAEPTKSDIMLEHGAVNLLLPTEQFNVTDYMSLPMVIDTNLLEDMILIDNKPLTTGRINKPEPQFQEFKWPKDKPFVKTDLPSMSQEELYKQYYCTPAPVEKGKQRISQATIMPSNTPGCFVAWGRNEGGKQIRTSRIVKIDIEAGTIETLNSIYEIV